MSDDGMNELTQELFGVALEAIHALTEVVEASGCQCMADKMKAIANDFAGVCLWWNTMLKEDTHGPENKSEPDTGTSDTGRSDPDAEETVRAGYP